VALLPAVACASGDASTDGNVALEREIVPLFTVGPEGSNWAFNDLRGIAFDSAGRIWVAEYDGAIHLFENDGGYIRTIKRTGDGPGEFETILSFDLDPESNRIILETNDHFGKEVFLLSAEFAEIAHWTTPRMLGSVFLGVRFLPGSGGRGLLFPVSQRVDTAAKDNVLLTWTSGVLAHSDSSGAVMDTVAPLVGGWSYRVTGPDGFSMNAPQRGREIWLPVDTLGVLVGDGHREYNLSLVNRAGDTLRRYKRRVAREVLTDIEGPGLTRGNIVRALFDKPRGEILLCRVPRPASYPASEVDYFSVEGTYLGTLSWPQCPVRADDTGRIYSFGRDENGLPFISVHTYK
jgi:hypothetical protein